MVPECQPTNALVFGGANPVFARTAGQISAQNLAYVFLLFSEYYNPSVDPSGWTAKEVWSITFDMVRKLNNTIILLKLNA